MTLKAGSCDVQKVYVGACEIKRIYVGSCVIYDATPIVTLAFWGITPDPDTYVMLDVREGTPPIEDARIADIELPDQSGIYNAFGLELPYELGEVTGEVNSRVVTAVEGEAPIQFFDSFDNDNGTALTDHTPDIDVNGQGWVVLNGSMVLVGDACNTEAANSHASIDIGIMDVDIEEQVFIYDEWAGFSLRVQDHDNCIVAYLHVDGIMEIGEFVGGVYATLNSSSGHTVGYQQTHDVRVTQVGDDITLYFDGAELSATTTRFPGVTSIGLRSGLATAQLGGAKWLDITVHAEAEIEVPWLAHAPEATNLTTTCRDHRNNSNAAGVSIAQAAGVDGTQQWIAIGDTSATVANVSIGPLVNLSGTFSWLCGVFWIEKQVNTGFFTEVGLTPSIYTAVDSCIITIDLETGDTAVRAGQPRAQHSVIDDGDFWKVVLAVESPLDTDYRIVLYPCRYNSLVSDGGQSDATLQETVVSDAWQLYKGVHPDIVATLPPIYTGGAAATRDSSRITIPSINHSDAGDRYTFDVIVYGPCNVLATFLQYDGTDFILTDGTNECRVTAALGEHSIQIDYSAADGTMSLAVDGGVPDSSNYSGTLLVRDGSDLLRLFGDCAFVGKARNVRRTGPPGIAPQYVVHDDFEIDGSLDGRMPVIGDNAWSASQIEAGYGVIYCTVSSVTRTALIESGLSDCIVSMIHNRNHRTVESGPVFRRASSDSYFIVSCSLTTTSVVRYVGGAKTTLGSISFGAASTAYKYNIVLKGDSIKVYIDNVLKFDLTDSNNQLATTHGVSVHKYFQEPPNWDQLEYCDNFNVGEL